MSSTLPPEQWRPLARAHAQRVDQLTAGRRRRRALGHRHPVEDFLFEYYNHRPAQLRRWHPGPGVVLEDAAEEHGTWAGYLTDTAGLAWVDVEGVSARRSSTIGFVEGLLRATLARDPHLGCFGLHEWAMVYRLEQGQRRHEQLPLRLGQDETDAVVERHQVRCSHYDAYRFFTGPAAPRNHLRPTRETQTELEQPGCLHAGMDVYKWCFKLGPLVPSDLTLAAFELALEIRELDMAASPYDVSAYGIAAVPVETAAGKADYLARQRDFANRSNALRSRLIEVLSALPR